MKPQSTPRMNPETPRLSVMCREQKHPFVCQNCGGSHLSGHGNGLMRLVLDRWQECDHNDKPELIVIVLCSHCAKKIVQPHPRLYDKLSANAPFAGCMALCVDCEWRDGVTCSHRHSKASGGDGVHVGIKPSINCLVDGKNYRGPVQLWPEPPQYCGEWKPRAEPAKPKTDLFK